MDRVLVILVGGLLPALAFGLAGVFQKGAALQGVGAGTYMFYVGLVFIAAGLVLRAVFGEADWAVIGMPMALLGGLGFAIGVGAISFAVLRLGAPISLIAPITVVSTLVTVVLGFLVFKEHEGVAALKLLGGAVLVMAGAALVATS
jgi:transporter family protein